MYKIGYTYGFPTMDGGDSQTIKDDSSFNTIEEARAAIPEYLRWLKEEHNGNGTWLEKLFIVLPDKSVEYHYKHDRN